MSVLNTSNPIALRYLFDETLFVFEEERQIKHQEQSADEPKLQTVPTIMKSWGLNQQNILFVHRTPNHENLDLIAMDAFLKILGALRLQESDVALFNLAQEGMGEEEPMIFSNALQSGKLIFLGQNLDAVVKAAKPANPGQPAYLVTYSFAEMLADESKKRQFWNDLKAFLA